MRVLVIADPLGKFDLDGDTTYALMLELARRDHEVWTCEVGDLGLEHDDPIARACVTIVTRAATPAEAFVREPPTPIPLESFDIVMMRKDPPVDVQYLQATWILERARGKTLLVNDPRGLRELNEHLCILEFPELTPPTIVTRDTGRLTEFCSEQGGAIVVKPIDGYAGLGIFLVKIGDPNMSSLFETSTAAGSQWCMAQRYLPEATEGDKRIVLAGGKPIGAVLRVPPKDEARGNLHVGASAVAAQLDDDDMNIIRTVTPMLERWGQIFVGLDVIGGRLTEMNITSPTGIRHIEKLENRNVAAPVIDCFEERARLL